MKLTHLDLTNFRSFRGTTVPLDAPRLLFAGLNGSGKTSVAEAITWVLTGCSSLTDARGAGAEVLIPEGGKIAEAAVTIEGIGKVSRAYAEKGGGSFSVQGMTGTGQIQQQALYNKLNTTPEFLRAVLSTEAFLDLNHVEAKAMVLSLLGVQFEIREPLTAEHSERIITYTLDELDMHYKQAFEDRKAAKKVLASCVVPDKPQGQMPTIQAIEDQLGKLRMDLGALQKVVGSVSGRRQSLQGEQERLQAVLNQAVGEDLSGQIDGLQAKLASLEAAVVPIQHGEAPKKGDAVAQLAYLRPKVQQLQNYEPSNKCVFDPGIPCKTPAKAFSDRLAEMVAELKALDPKPEKSAQTVTESPLTTIRNQIHGLEIHQHNRQMLIKGRDLAEQRAEEIRQELDALPQTATQDAEIATLQIRIGKGEELLKNARIYWHAVETYDDAVKRQQIQKAEVDRLESLVEQLGPNGIRVQALAEAMGKFEAAVNPYVQPFGWTITFSVDPWMTFANGRPVETYSRSERYRIGIALQMGIAMMSGLNFAIVDEIDMLSHDNRQAVTSMLLKAPLDQILILGTREPNQALPKMPGVIAYRLSRLADDKGSNISERSVA